MTQYVNHLAQYVSINNCLLSIRILKIRKFCTYVVIHALLAYVRTGLLILVSLLRLQKTLSQNLRMLEH